MQKLWDTYFRKKQQQQPSTSPSSPGPQRRQHTPLSQRLSLTSPSNVPSSPRFRRANLSATHHQWQSTSQLPSKTVEPDAKTVEPEKVEPGKDEIGDVKREEEVIFSFCKTISKSSDETPASTTTVSCGNQLGPPLFSPPPLTIPLSSTNQQGFSSPPPSPTRLNFSSRPVSRSISQGKGSPPQSPIVAKSSSSSPCFLSPTPDLDLLGFDPKGLGSNSLELPQNSRSISCDDVRKYKKSSTGSIGGGAGPRLKVAKAASPVLLYYQSHHERSASMAGETIVSPSGLEVPATAKSCRSKSFDAASAAKAAAASAGQETQVTSASSGVIGGTSGTSTSNVQTGKRRVRGSGGFLEIPKWKMLIRRSSAAVGAGSGGSGSGPAGTLTGGSGSTIGQQGGSTFTVDETTGLYWRDCIHCLLLIEMLKISPPVSCKSSVSSEGSQESEPSSTIIPAVSTTSSSTFTTVSAGAVGRSRSASCQSALEGVDINLVVLREAGSGSCFTDESEEMKMIEASAIKSKSMLVGDGAGSGFSSHVNSGSPSPIPLVTLSFAPDDEFQTEEEDLGNGVTVISLEVPVLPKSGRSASMDNSYLQVPRAPVHDFELPPGKSIRSRSVDIALPVGSDGPYIIVPSEKPIPATTQKAIQGEIKISTENGETRTLRCAPDWGETAINGDHLWVSTNASGDLCYVGESECSKQGPRLCCPVCKITAHTGCIGILIDKIKFHCRPTFKDVGVRQYREQTVIPHHWVHRRYQKGRCKQCSKSFQSKLSFGNKEIVALSCSWCKSTYHNKENCFSMDRLSEMCRLGPHGDLIVPPSWIVKLPRKGSFKSSIRRAPKSKRPSSKRRGSGTGNSNESACGQQLGTSCDNGNNPSNSTLGNLNYNQSNPDNPLSSSPPPPIGGSGHQRHHRVSLTPEDALAISDGVESPSPPPPPATTTARKSVTSLHRSFAIKPIPCSNSKPLLVFINPKSGGNQGGKLIQKFQWLLNPRQVFDLNQGGPKPGLELYKKVPNLRILACGGDGTAGWIFSALDDIYGYNKSITGSDGVHNSVTIQQQQSMPPVAILPLGTGNDLSRAFGWGGGYTDEPVSKILFNVKDGDIVQLDRWDLVVEPNTAVTTNVSGDVIFNELSSSSSVTLLDEEPAGLSSSVSGSGREKDVRDTLPMNVINNYFSIGVDAHIALEFHEAREAHPERFNSRLRNKMFYGQAGGKDLLQRKWKDLCNYITLECDGVDYTQRLKDLKIHSLLFLNIPSYGGGTRPWGGSSPVYESPATDDGLIEVIGLTTYQLPLLQAGGHGSCIAQCSSANIITSRTVPMQVDGEPCRLLPSIIQLRFRNQATVVAKAKTHSQPIHVPTLGKVTFAVRKLNITEYETYHYEKDKLRDASVHLGDLTIEPNLELDRVRYQINQMVAAIMAETTDEPPLDSPILKANEEEDTSCSISNRNGSQNKSKMIDKLTLSPDWCFIDSCTAERYFRVDRAQEHLHYVVDICNEDLYILEEDCTNTISSPPPPTAVTLSEDDEQKRVEKEGEKMSGKEDEKRTDLEKESDGNQSRFIKLQREERDGKDGNKNRERPWD